MLILENAMFYFFLKIKIVFDEEK
jgi:hypothetical protein